jgi:hypothetical protein
MFHAYLSAVWGVVAIGTVSVIGAGNRSEAAGAQPSGGFSPSTLLPNYFESE